MIKNCEKCNKEFKTKPCHAHRRKYCSYACYWKVKKGSKRPQEQIEKFRNTLLKLHLVGEKSGNWRGGVTPIHQAIRSSTEYALWRTAVFIRDNRKCVWCGSGEKIQADHIKPFCLYPELRFAIDNGRTLCKECHRTTDTYGCKKSDYKNLRNRKEIICQ